ncbi:MAG: methyltransferase domain-containing protein [Magnetococcales bacterium]|nr:methyltransferase domain-containing protein [Magnetococcales bacterium]
MMRHQKIAATFGAVANQYEQRAEVQRYAAEALTRRIKRLDLPATPLILEIGCGSGLVSRPLLRHYPKGRFLLTDLSLAMIQAAQRQNGHEGNIWYAVMDGERPSVAAGFDLIFSGLTWQWFQDPLGSFARLTALLRPGGWLVFSTLGEQTFQEWRKACESVGIPCGAITHPARSIWESAKTLVEEEILITRHASALDFLQSLQAIGANHPSPGHCPVPGGALRRLLRRHPAGFNDCYHLLYVSYQA